MMSVADARVKEISKAKHLARQYVDGILRNPDNSSVTWTSRESLGGRGNFLIVEFRIALTKGGYSRDKIHYPLK